MSWEKKVRPLCSQLAMVFNGPTLTDVDMEDVQIVDITGAFIPRGTRFKVRSIYLVECTLEDAADFVIGHAGAFICTDSSAMEMIAAALPGTELIITHVDLPCLAPAIIATKAKSIHISRSTIGDIQNVIDAACDNEYLENINLPKGSIIKVNLCNAKALKTMVLDGVIHRKYTASPEECAS